MAYNAKLAQQISCNGDTQSLPAVNGSVQLEILVDRNTIEIFGNNGQLYMPLPANNSARQFPDLADSALVEVPVLVP